jgi:transcriptional regulator with XRE-family HTH domain
MRALRLAASIPQTVAASRAGIDRTSWGRIEAARLDVRLDTLLRIQFALRVDTLEGLFGETTGDLFGRDAGDDTPSPVPGEGVASTSSTERTAPR